MYIPVSIEVFSDQKLLGTVADTIIAALTRAYIAYERLGTGDTELQTTNRLGKTCLWADMLAEQAMISTLQEKNIRTTIRSREHGDRTLLADSSRPHLLAIMHNDRRYSNLALYFGANPSFGDFMAAGSLERDTRHLYIARRTMGTVALDIERGSLNGLRTSMTYNLSPATARIFVDTTKVGRGDPLHSFYATTRTTFSEPLRHLDFVPKRLASPNGHYIEMAKGKATLIGDATREGNLLLATAYPLVKEAGGVMMTFTRGAVNDLGYKNVLDFGHHNHLPVLTASNEEIAMQAASLLLGEII